MIVQIFYHILFTKLHSIYLNLLHRTSLTFILINHLILRFIVYFAFRVMIDLGVSFGAKFITNVVIR